MGEVLVDMKIGVIGIGVVGSAIRTVMKFYGNDVRCYDKCKPSDAFETVCNTDLVFIAVPTDEKDGRLDCSIVRQVLDRLEENSYRGVVCIKSTIRVGFLEEARNSHLKLRIIYVPEFLHERSRLADFVSPDYVVMSGKKEDVGILRKAFYWVDDSKFFHVDDRTAEVTKLAVNAYAATKISFTNEIARICKEVGADVETLMEILRHDKRCAEEYTDPTRGPYGGKCLPKDTRELIRCTSNPILLSAVEKTNEERKKEDKRRK